MTPVVTRWARKPSQAILPRQTTTRTLGRAGDFGGKVEGAGADFVGGGLVAGRRAADDRGDPGVAEFEAVVAMQSAGFGGKAEGIEDGIHEVAGAVAGEGASGAVGTVGSGGEAQDEDAGFGVAEAGDGSRPVGLVDVGAATGFAEAGAVEAEARASFAGDDGVACGGKWFGEQNWKDRWHVLDDRTWGKERRRGNGGVMFRFGTEGPIFSRWHVETQLMSLMSIDLGMGSRIESGLFRAEMRRGANWKRRELARCT